MKNGFCILNHKEKGFGTLVGRTSLGSQKSDFFCSQKRTKANKSLIKEIHAKWRRFDKNTRRPRKVRPLTANLGANLGATKYIF